MSNTKSKSTTNKVDDLLNYLDGSKGLRLIQDDNGKIQIHQIMDGKRLSFSALDIGELLHRVDSESKAFLQINFINGNKILITDSLVGFKPVEILGLDMNRLPKVVTTPDLQSVYEAIQEALGAESSQEHEIEMLKKVYYSILSGGEKVGIGLAFEKQWFVRLSASALKAAA